MDDRIFGDFDAIFLNIPDVAIMDDQDRQILPLFSSLPFDVLPATPQSQTSMNSSGDSYPVLETPAHNPPPIQVDIPNLTTSSALQHPYTQEQRKHMKDEASYRSSHRLTAEEKTVNLVEYVKNETPPLSNTPVLPSPLLYLSLTPNPGIYNFTVSIPKLTRIGSGVRPKWCYSHVTNKLYAAKRITFPVNIKLERFPPSAFLVICPVYNGSSERALPVERCYLCKSADQNPEAKNHVIQVEGSYPSYFFHDKRFMVSLPLPSPAPGDTSSQIFLKMTCNTSCLGGPCRRPFSILVILIVNNTEMGRQVIDTKCCEGPIRDMNNDEANLLKSVKEGNTAKVQAVRRIASEINPRKGPRMKASKTMKLKKSTCFRIIDETPKLEEFMRVPPRFQKKVKRYMNMLYMREQNKKYNLKFKLFSSETDSE